MANLKGKTILVVDDEVEIREILREEFRQAGAQVVEASGGLDALRLMTQNKIDAIVSDIRMPKGSGIELLDQVRSENITTPVILLFSHFNDVSIEDAYDKGADAIFGKPFDLEMIANRIELLLAPVKERFSKRQERVDAPAEVRIKRKNIEDTLHGKLLNIGRGGMFVCLDDVIPKVGEGIEFKINFDEGDFSILSGIGLNRWVRLTASEGMPKGMGIEFVSLSPSSTQSLMTFLSHNLPRAFIPKGPK